jgi:phage repressor protein C with HTH and peptisase S24 domain
MDIKERIKHAREYRNISQRKLAAMEEMNPTDFSEISRWERGINKPSYEKLEKLANALQISLQWLKTGEGDMLDTSNTPALGNKKIKLEDIAQPLGPMKLIRLREIGSVRAGNFTTLHELDGEPVTFQVPLDMLPKDDRIKDPRKLIQKFFVFRVKGDSMYPKLEEGDIIVVKLIDDINAIPTSKIIIAINSDFEIVVKRLKKKNGKLTLSSDNADKEKYPDIEVDANTNAIAEVIGQISFNF